MTTVTVTLEAPAGVAELVAENERLRRQIELYRQATNGAQAMLAEALARPSLEEL